MKLAEPVDVAIMTAVTRFNKKNPGLTPDEIRASFKRLEARLTAEETKKDKATP
jgi:hypothetical protein